VSCYHIVKAMVFFIMFHDEENEQRVIRAIEDKLNDI
jgi:hypothetical protein